MCDKLRRVFLNILHSPRHKAISCFVSLKVIKVRAEEEGGENLYVLPREIIVD